MYKMALVGLSVLFSCIIIAAVAQSNSTNYHKFAANLYQEAQKNRKSNFVLSPLSTELVLAVTLMGSSGATADEIGSVLYLSKEEQENLQSYEPFLSYLSDNNQLATARGIFVQKERQVDADFQQCAKNNFSADTQQVDFNLKENAAQTINQWIKKTTNGYITAIVESDLLSNSNELVLVNALHFHYEWATAFYDISTGPFHKSNTEDVTVDLMKVHGFFKMNRNSKLNATFMELPYILQYMPIDYNNYNDYNDNNDTDMESMMESMMPKTKDQLSMIVVLPDEKDGLATLESNMETVFAHKLAESFGAVTAIMPKFIIDSTMQMVDSLKNMGIKDLFSAQSNISKMLNATGVFVNNVVQKTFISVNEKGEQDGGIPWDMFEAMHTIFQADHPFVFYIQLKGRILVVGRYTGPENKEEQQMK